MDEDVLRLVEEFVGLLVSILSPGLGAFREPVEGLLQQAAELYGNVGAHRGLAAGEAVEELQILREILLRCLHADPPGDGASSVALRDFLQLNRLVDRGVTYASVGHTDTLFFNLLHGAGVSSAPDHVILGVVRQQVGALRDELEDLTLHASGEAPHHSVG